MMQLDAPIALFVFNRPETSRRVFAAIAAARPARLLLIADGPRPDRAGEAERCAQVRNIVTAVDWPCEVETNFAEQNMGCRRRMISGLDWVFSRVEEAIILEDDCLPDPSFFPFCAEMLDRYRDKPQVAYVAGFNPLQDEFSLASSYYYSQVACTWGWASWRRAWREFDEHISSWPEVKAAGILSLLFPRRSIVKYWTRVFDAMYGGTGPSAWDYQWSYGCWVRNWLGIIPGRNLIQNIGFGSGATHTTAADQALRLSAQPLQFPLRHPPAITAWPDYAMRMHERFFAVSIATRIRAKLSRFL
jgi:hypothetical protein